MSFSNESMSGRWTSQGWMGPGMRRLRLAMHFLLAGGIAGASGSAVAAIVRMFRGFDPVGGGISMLENLVAAAATILAVCLWWRATRALSAMSEAVQGPSLAAPGPRAVAVPMSAPPLGDPIPPWQRAPDALPVRPFHPADGWALRSLRSLAVATMVLYMVHAVALLARSVYYFSRYGLGYSWSFGLTELLYGLGWATWAVTWGFFLYAIADAISQTAEAALAARGR